MKKVLVLVICITLLTSCSGLNRYEQSQLRKLEAHGVSIDHPVGDYDKPASPIVAGLLNILPGVGNFYLGCGNAAEPPHILYGVINLLWWPFSVVWAIPEAAIDANNINKRDMIYYYIYDEQGRKELRKAGIRLTE